MDYLATGFARVDSSEDQGFYAACLGLIDSLPYYQWLKRESYGHLDLRPGQRVLDAGCGLGDDVCRLARWIAPGGLVMGIDSSSALISQACARSNGGSEEVAFGVADARALPFGARTFDRVRMDRALQHIPHPEQAIAELHRVLKGGGLAVVYDNDWGSFSLSSEDVHFTRRVEDEWRYSFTNPWIGRHLRLHFIRAGFTEVAIYPSVSVIGDFETADRIYNLRRTLDRLIASGTRSEYAERWVADLHEQSHQGSFQCALTAYLAVGRKPW